MVVSPLSSIPFLAVCALLGARLTAQENKPATEPGKAAEAPIPIPSDAEAASKGLPLRELSLDDALRMGRANNVDLRAAELLPRQARMDLLVAEAGFNPELYGDVGYADAQSPSRSAFQPSTKRKTADATIGWRQRVVTGGLFDLAYQPARIATSSAAVGVFPDRQYTSAWTATYTQPLLRSAWTDYNTAGIQSAKYAVARSQHQLDGAVQDTLLAIVGAYWELAFARENYRVVVAALQVAREQLRITQERIRVQELAPRDRIADEAEVARRQEETITAENLIRAREDALRRLLFGDQQEGLWTFGLRPSSEIAVTPAVETLPWQEYCQQAVDDRPDLKALRSEVSVAEQDVLVATRDTLPGLDLVGTYSSDGVRDQFRDAWDDSFEQNYPDWGLRLQFSIPIGNQAARARRQKAELELERRQRTLYGSILNVQKDVRDAVRSLESLAQSIRASGESVRLAENNLETEQVKLRVGSSTAFEVQRRNQDLREARSRHLRNQLDYRVAQSRLLHARGKLLVPQ